MKVPANLRDGAVFDCITPPEKSKACPCNVHNQVKGRPDDYQPSEQEQYLFTLNAIPDSKRSENKFIDTKWNSDGDA
jgi:hypothetical protein